MPKNLRGTVLCAFALLGAAALAAGQKPASKSEQAASPFALLRPADYRHYVEQFAADEREATGSQPADEWPWMEANIPLFDSSDKQFEEMYYFRWYAWQKHLVHAKRGYIITEWLPKPEMPDGLYGALPDAAPFHLGEARWLRNPQIAEDYARLWADPAAGARKYSFPWANSVRQVALATGDPKLGIDLLPALIENFKAWDDHFDPAVGLYWQIDTRDAMEKSIGGDGYRPVLNSYMVADAKSIAGFEAAAKQLQLATEYTGMGDRLQWAIETKLWNPTDQFYEVVSPAADSGIRKEKRFKDPGTALQFSGVRELIGYIPWAYFRPEAAHDAAWKQLFDPKGFAGQFGPTTAERRSPRFRFASSDQCTWNGPSWPYATTQTLLALADLLHGPPQAIIGKRQYYQLFANYVRSQHIKLPSGRVIDWIDEDLDADTGEWIAKDILIAKHKQVGRGNYYNHSGFADPLITGLIGLRPQLGNLLELDPLLPANAWSYFAIDGLPYHGHFLTIIYDPTGEHYHRGRGFFVITDGRTIVHRPELGQLQAELPR